MDIYRKLYHLDMLKAMYTEELQHGKYLFSAPSTEYDKKVAERINDLLAERLERLAR